MKSCAALFVMALAVLATAPPSSVVAARQLRQAPTTPATLVAFITGLVGSPVTAPIINQFGALVTALPGLGNLDVQPFVGIINAYLTSAAAGDLDPTTALAAILSTINTQLGGSAPAQSAALTRTVAATTGGQGVSFPTLAPLDLARLRTAAATVPGLIASAANGNGTAIRALVTTVASVLPLDRAVGAIGGLPVVGPAVGTVLPSVPGLVNSGTAAITNPTQATITTAANQVVAVLRSLAPAPAPKP